MILQKSSSKSSVVASSSLSAAAIAAWRASSAGETSSSTSDWGWNYCLFRDFAGVNLFLLLKIGIMYILSSERIVGRRGCVWRAASWSIGHGEPSRMVRTGIGRRDYLWLSSSLYNSSFHWCLGGARIIRTLTFFIVLSVYCLGIVGCLPFMSSSL